MGFLIFIILFLGFMFIGGFIFFIVGLIENRRQEYHATTHIILGVILMVPFLPVILAMLLSFISEINPHLIRKISDISNLR